MEIFMKKIITLILISLILSTLVSCSGNNGTDNNADNGSNANDNGTDNQDNSESEIKDYYAHVCAQLNETSMGGTEYPQSQVDEFEKRFTKMNLTAGFKKVNHFRSKTEYAYVILFENADDAQIFFENITTGDYNVKKFDSVVIYGKSDSIENLK